MGPAAGGAAALPWRWAAEVEGDYQVIRRAARSGKSLNIKESKLFPLRFLDEAALKTLAWWNSASASAPQMKDSLLSLQRGVGLREYSSEPEDKSRYHWPPAGGRGRAVQYGSWSLWSSMQAGPQGRSSPAHRTTGKGRAQALAGAAVDGVRHASSSLTWRSTPFFLSFTSSCIPLSGRSSREEDRKVVHAFRARSPLPPVSVGTVQVLELSRLLHTFCPLEVLAAAAPSGEGQHGPSQGWFPGCYLWDPDFGVFCLSSVAPCSVWLFSLR